MRIPAAALVHETSVSKLESAIELRPGELCIRYHGAEDLAARLFDFRRPWRTTGKRLYRRWKGRPLDRKVDETARFLYRTAQNSILINSVMSWLKRKTSRRPAFAVGAYKLGDPTPSIHLQEFSDVEYQTMRRQFKDEQNFNAPKVEFPGYIWNLQLGTVAGRIYKIAPYLRFLTEAEANPVATSAFRYCTAQLGQPHRLQTGLFIWDTSDGNVVLQTAETAEGFVISIFLTWNAVRGFDRN